jgi:hypothetical protein
MAAFAADATLHKTVALWTTLQFQGNFSLRAGADHHFNSFLELFRLEPGSKERGKLAKREGNLKRLARSLAGGAQPLVAVSPQSKHHYQRWLVSCVQQNLRSSCRLLDRFLTFLRFAEFDQGFRPTGRAS